MQIATDRWSIRGWKFSTKKKKTFTVLPAGLLKTLWVEALQDLVLLVGHDDHEVTKGAWLQVLNPRRCDLILLLPFLDLLEHHGFHDPLEGPPRELRLTVPIHTLKTGEALANQCSNMSDRGRWWVSQLKILKRDNSNSRSLRKTEKIQVVEVLLSNTREPP